MTSKLGSFDRTHRERITPESTGLLSGGRRRTPGLRREELAALCGVSTTWITWLEQGRPASASAKTLTHLATALRLSDAERRYLFKLADKVDPSATLNKPAVNTISNEVHRLVRVIQTPAYVLDRHWNAVAWNDQATRLFLGWLDRESQNGERNLLQHMFLQPSARELVNDWAERARRLVAEFREECGKTVDEPPLNDLVASLKSHSRDFSYFWDAQEVVAREGGIRAFTHPTEGPLKFEQIALQLQGHTDLKLTILLEMK